MGADEEEWRKAYVDLATRMTVFERALFGVIDEHTNLLMPGLLQTSRDTSQKVDQLAKWVKTAALVGAAFVLLIAFPRLFDLFRIAFKAAG